MRVIGSFLLVIVLLPVAYGQYRHDQELGDDGGNPICVSNLRTSVDCAFGAEPQQAMVLVRGQLLTLPSTPHE